MTRPGSARAPKGAAGGACRPSRRREGARGRGWVRPYRRAQRALDSAASLIVSTIHAVVDAGRCGERRPVRTVRRLNGAVREMTVASLRLIEARRELAEASEALDREPEQQSGDAPELMELAAARCQAVAAYIPFALTEVAFAQVEILGGVGTGELVPERPSDGRRRIVLTPRPLFVRAFLASRQPRISDRITPALLRRRRTPAPPRSVFPDAISGAVLLLSLRPARSDSSAQSKKDGEFEMTSIDVDPTEPRIPTPRRRNCASRSCTSGGSRSRASRFPRPRMRRGG